MIWTNVAIFLISAVLWSLVSQMLWPNHKYWVDFLAGAAMTAGMVFLGYPLWQ